MSVRPNVSFNPNARRLTNDLRMKFFIDFSISFCYLNPYVPHGIEDNKKNIDIDYKITLDPTEPVRTNIAEVGAK